MGERVGVRELQRNASRVLRRVKAGESVEVTERGRLVAVLIPPPAEAAAWEALVAAGKVTPGTGDLGNWKTLPAQPGIRPLSEVLIEMRDEDDR